MAHPAKILVFDSGAGGLTIARDILNKLPGCELIYAADNQYFPYGIIEESTLIHRVSHLVSTLVEEYSPDIIVIACNTASTITLPFLRSNFDIPFVGVVPAIKPAAEKSLSGVIGILATPATVEREYTDQLVRDFAKDHTVYRYGSSKLVNMAELLLSAETIDHAELRNEILKLFVQDKSNTMDTVVLGCTHFPLLRDALTNLGEFSHINWMDCGEAIARRVSYCLKQQHHPSNSTEVSIRFVYTCPSTSTQVMRNYQRYLCGDCTHTHEHRILESE